MMGKIIGLVFEDEPQENINPAAEEAEEQEPEQVTKKPRTKKE